MLRNSSKEGIEYMCSALHRAEEEEKKFILLPYHQMLILTLAYVLFILANTRVTIIC